MCGMETDDMPPVLGNSELQKLFGLDPGSVKYLLRQPGFPKVHNLAGSRVVETGALSEWLEGPGAETRYGKKADWHALGEHLARLDAEWETKQAAELESEGKKS